MSTKPPSKPADTQNRACLGAIAGPHGVRGGVKIKCFTQSPEAIASYGPVESEDGTRRFSLKIVNVARADLVVASAPEITSREDAESLKGTRLYVDRARLPAPDEDEFYLDDLVGLNVIDEDGAPAGIIAAVYNFGAGDVLEVKNIPDMKGVRLIAFTKDNVPEIDIKGGSLIIKRDALSDDANDDDGKEEPDQKG